MKNIGRETRNGFLKCTTDLLIKIEYNGKYAHFSATANAFVTQFMTIGEFRKYAKESFDELGSYSLDFNNYKIVPDILPAITLMRDRDSSAYMLHCVGLSREEANDLIDLYGIPTDERKVDKISDEIPTDPLKAVSLSAKMMMASHIIGSPKDALSDSEAVWISRYLSFWLGSDDFKQELETIFMTAGLPMPKRP